ncbi:hypothetical protein F5888DRAFT_1891111 [Russula emetica]|nr:hypothetical protein F5888DRAFT_1891111 [Russula emetica]
MRNVTEMIVSQTTHRLALYWSQQRSDRKMVGNYCKGLGNKGGRISALKQPDNEQSGARVLAHDRTKRKAGNCSEYNPLQPLASLSPSESKLLPNALWSIRVLVLPNDQLDYWKKMLLPVRSASAVLSGSSGTGRACSRYYISIIAVRLSPIIASPHFPGHGILATPCSEHFAELSVVIKLVTLLGYLGRLRTPHCRARHNQYLPRFHKAGLGSYQPPPSHCPRQLDEYWSRPTKRHICGASVNFGSPQSGSYRSSTQGLHRYGPSLLGQCGGGTTNTGCFDPHGLLYHACVSQGGQGVQNTLGGSVVTSSLLAITGASALRRLLGASPLTRL